jgi:hypothetical protein
VSDAEAYSAGELYELEQFLLQVREATRTGTYDTWNVLIRWQGELPRLHAFVRGLLYNL